MSQLAKLLRTGTLGLMVNLMLASTVYVFAQAHQGRSGTWSTGAMGMCLGACYIRKCILKL